MKFIVEVEEVFDEGDNLTYDLLHEALRDSGLNTKITYADLSTVYTLLQQLEDQP